MGPWGPPNALPATPLHPAEFSGVGNALRRRRLARIQKEVGEKWDAVSADLLRHAATLDPLCLLATALSWRILGTGGRLMAGSCPGSVGLTGCIYHISMMARGQPTAELAEEQILMKEGSPSAATSPRRAKPLPSKFLPALAKTGKAKDHMPRCGSSPSTTRGATPMDILLLNGLAALAPAPATARWLQLEGGAVRLGRALISLRRDVRTPPMR